MAETLIQKLTEEVKLLKEESERINAIDPSDVNEYYLQEGRRLFRRISNKIASLNYKEFIKNQQAEVDEAQQVRQDKIDKLQDIVIRSTKKTYGHENLILAAQINRLKGHLLTESKLLSNWIDLATHEVKRQSNIV